MQIGDYTSEPFALDASANEVKNALHGGGILDIDVQASNFTDENGHTSWYITLGDDYDGKGYIPFLTNTITPVLSTDNDLILPILGRQHVSFDWDIGQSAIPSHEIYRIITTTAGNNGAVNCSARGKDWESFDPLTVTPSELRTIAVNAGMPGYLSSNNLFVVEASVSNSVNMAWDIVFASETSTIDITFDVEMQSQSRVQETNIVTEPGGLFTLNLYDSFSGGMVTTGNFLDVTSVGDLTAMQDVLDAVPDLLSVSLDTAYNSGSGSSIYLTFDGGNCYGMPGSHTCGNVPLMSISSVSLTGPRFTTVLRRRLPAVK